MAEHRVAAASTAGVPGTSAMGASLLSVRGLSRQFGGVTVLDGLTLELAEGELLAVVGPNGCGKTTFFRLISGELLPDAGEIRFRDRSITGLKPFEVARLGIGRKFQVPSIYPRLSVTETLLLSGAAGDRPFGRLLRASRSGGTELEELLSMIGLAERREVPAGSLSHGEKQWLEIGMVLATRPSLLLLDEPTAGMTLGETAATAELLERIRRERSVAMIVIEHDMAFVELLGSPVAVMLKGRIHARGSFADLRKDPAVIEAYLGRRPS